MDIKNRKSNFICTSDKDTADKLLEYGLPLIDSKNNVFTFLNCQALFKEDESIKNVFYSNILSM